MRIAICDDNEAEVSLLEEKIRNCMPQSITVTKIDSFFSATQLLENNEVYELVFFDCDLPDIHGMDAARMYKEKYQTASIIFVTAYAEYAADGYEVDALRYLLKPISDEKLAEALRVFEHRSNNDCILEITGTKNAVFVKSEEIMYIEAVGRRTIVRFADRSVDSRKSISVFEKEITNDSFIKTRRQFIVNMKHIEKKEGSIICMTNGEKVEISRRLLGEFNRAYINYLKFNG